MGKYEGSFRGIGPELYDLYREYDMSTILMRHQKRKTNVSSAAEIESNATNTREIESILQKVYGEISDPQGENKDEQERTAEYIHQKLANQEERPKKDTAK